MQRLLGRHDPGPCPVDDTPHTACTAGPPADAVIVRTRQDRSVTVPLPRPAWLPPSPPVIVTEHTVSEPFTTAEYTRAKHGPAIGKGKRRR